MAIFVILGKRHYILWRPKYSHFELRLGVMMDWKDHFKNAIVVRPVDAFMALQGCTRKTAQNIVALALCGKYDFPFPIRRIGIGKPFCRVNEVLAAIEMANQIAGPLPIALEAASDKAVSKEPIRRGRGRPRKGAIGG
ncbi:hypothetical protein [Dechloromonas sp. HYN0024]|uniref:hypothetical protein n=1 Tax=Dechloromonas sp. HYN0024 TaxID=2231055 RepID=UPI0013C2E82B|nr:hypothetical protein [Dechloromonas sp. HYN0024]